MSDGVKIAVNLAELEKAYKKAVSEGAAIFTCGGNEFVTKYVAYLLEYYKGLYRE